MLTLQTPDGSGNIGQQTLMLAPLTHLKALRIKAQYRHLVVGE